MSSVNEYMKFPSHIKIRKSINLKYIFNPTILRNNFTLQIKYRRFKNYQMLEIILRTNLTLSTSKTLTKIRSKNSKNFHSLLNIIMSYDIDTKISWITYLNLILKRLLLNKTKTAISSIENREYPMVCYNINRK